MAEGNYSWLFAPICGRLDTLVGVLGCLQFFVVMKMNGAMNEFFAVALCNGRVLDRFNIDIRARLLNLGI